MTGARRPHRRPAKSLQRIVFAGFLLFIACTGDKDTALEAFPEGFPPDLAYHLTSSDDSTLAICAREAGYAKIRRALGTLDQRMIALGHKGLLKEALALRKYQRRLAKTCASVYHDESLIRGVAFIDSLPPDRLSELLPLRHEYSMFRGGPRIPAAQAREKQLEFFEKFKTFGDDLWAASCIWEIAFLEEEMGNQDRHMECLQSACAAFAARGSQWMTCQALGVIGFNHERAGRIDSMFACYREARRIANRCRMPNQAARILGFYGGYYRKQGRFSLVHQLQNEAMDVCHRYKGGPMEIRFLYQAMNSYADLGCWDAVDYLLQQARFLERKFKGIETHYTPSKRYYYMQLLRLDQIEAQLKMARGDMAGADAIIEHVNREWPELDLPHTYRGDLIELSYHHADGLLANGRPGEAFEEARLGLERSQEEALPTLAARFALLVARAALELNDLEGSRTVLATFDRFAAGEEGKLRREWTERDALLGVIALKRRDRESAVLALENGVRRLRQSAAVMDACVESYLWLADCDELRQLMHELVSYDPLLGYGAEFFWRDFCELLGARERHLTQVSEVSKETAAAAGDITDTGETIIDTIRRRAADVFARVSELGAVHSVYLVHNEEIWRWTASREGVRREVLHVSTGEARRLTGEAHEMMSRHSPPQDAGLPRALCKKLRDLAHLLLPQEAFRETTPAQSAPFLITVDGFLGQIAFEALDIDTGDAYTPLLLNRDVAYVRRANPPVDEPASARGVILVNSKPEGRLLARHPFHPELSGVEMEGKTVAELDPTAIFLSQASGTKVNLTSVWDNASYVYIAAHMLGNPGIPYLTVIPLAVPSDDLPPEAAYLDISDIRAADLHQCDIVVLSGCSSGAPYVEGGAVGPSLGDAFLDAGAGAAVHTFWDVRDEDARQLMKSFVQEWQGGEKSKIRALCDARRQTLRGPSGIQHPFSWASYSIKVSRL